MKLKFTPLADGSIRILRVGLPVVSAELVYIAVSTANMSRWELARRGAYVYSEIEHTLMALLLLIGGALLFDLAWREAKSN